MVLDVVEVQDGKISLSLDEGNLAALNIWKDHNVGWVEKTAVKPWPALAGQPPEGRKTCLQVCIFDREPVKSAFALLSAKVTKKGQSPATSRTTNLREGSSNMAA